MISVSSTQWSGDEVIIDEEAIKSLSGTTSPTRDYNFLRVSCGVVKTISIHHFRQNIQQPGNEVSINKEAFKGYHR